jgi:hypothetical protein
MGGYLKNMFKTHDGKAWIRKATAIFEKRQWLDITIQDMETWVKTYVKPVEPWLSMSARNFAGAIDGALKTWAQSAGSHDPKQAALITALQGFEHLAGQLKYPPEAHDAWSKFMDANYSIMLTVALAADNLERKRTETPDLTIATVKTAETCARYLFEYGEVPKLAKMGREEDADKYWEARKNVLALDPRGQELFKDIAEAFKKLKGETEWHARAKLLDGLHEKVGMLAEHNDKFTSGTSKGLTEMCFAEAMRSPLDAYADDNPRDSQRSKLKKEDLDARRDQEVKEMRTHIKQRREHLEKHPDDRRTEE